MKHLKHIINGAIWTLFGSYIAVIVLLHVPAVQGFIGSEVSTALSNKFGTKICIGRVDLGFINRLIIDDVAIFDQKGKKMVEATRLSAKLDYIPLTQGKISISSVQIFGMQATLYKETAQSKPNFQFVIDSLASKDTTNHTPLDLKINSLIIRHGSIQYDRKDVAPKFMQFSKDHIKVSDISAHFIINTIKDDSLNIKVKKLSLKEASGLQILTLKLKFAANKNMALLQDFSIELPKSRFDIKDISATYSLYKGRIEWPSLSFEGQVCNSTITPSELSCFIPQLKEFIHPVQISSSFFGTSTSVRINHLYIGSTNGSINLKANGSISNWKSTPKWFANIANFNLSSDGIKFISDNLGKKFNIPTIVTRFGNINYHGVIGGYGRDIYAKGRFATGAGYAILVVGKHKQHLFGHIDTDGINLKQVLANNDFGIIKTSIKIDGEIPSNKKINIKAKGAVSQFDYKSYTYNNITIDGIFNNDVIGGEFCIDDPNGKINLKGSIDLSTKMHSAKLTAEVHHFNPSALKITDKWPDTNFDFNVSANLSGKSINTINGKLALSDFSMKSESRNYNLSLLCIKATNLQNSHNISLNSDFGNIVINGRYNFATIAQSFTNIICNKLPTFPGLMRSTHTDKNDFNIDATIKKTDWLQQIFNFPLQIEEPLHIDGMINDKAKQIDITINMPNFIYNDKIYRNGYIHISSPNDTLKANAYVKKKSDNGHNLELNIDASAINNKLNTIISFKKNNFYNIHGIINTETQFFKSSVGTSSARIKVNPSNIFVGDTIWKVKPSDIIYGTNNLTIDHFSIEHNKQHLIVSGLATKNPSDSLFVDIKDVDVSYILNLVNFHSVSFSGLATGRAYISNLFDKPQSAAKLLVNKFKFQNGRMGVLTANVNYNNTAEQIDINAIANDGPGSQTLINGYVSPKHNYIDLDIKAQNSRVEFVESFCSSFMHNIDAYGNGEIILSGPLNSMNLIGRIIVDGSAGISSLNTNYKLKNDTIDFIHNEIQFKKDKLYDKNGNLGVVSGSIYHQNLKKLTYNIKLEANDMLAYDFHEFGTNTFYGTIYATGSCNIRGKSGEISIDINAKPEKGSQLVYNVSSPETIRNNEFIRWNNSDKSGSINSARNNSNADIPSDIHLNFLINCTPDATLKLIMDNQTGDYISLNGNGIIHASYYNKGGYDMFGNYLVDHGIYKLTIQNAIKKDFQFKEGSTIVFGGDPYNAILNLNAQYTVNGVSLSDLNLGKSFSNNNIRVNCIMNITGTPKTPKIDFFLDMPTINNDAKQMIYSLINSEEEMNQQVIYLLAIGRFYNQGNNNSKTEEVAQQSQTSLAMQSILSGTLSQQINNVLSSFINNSNWNFGANISTGNEGWNNAEYEGILNGRLLNNRLLINGQFGYRDNANTTTSFIGDFDIRYLLYPNGNLAINVYNQTNDRYFTRNNLNTQGIGLIMKKDFNGWRDLFGKKSSKKKEKNRVKINK